MNQLRELAPLTTDVVEAESKAFELAQRKAAIYAKSSLVPQHYKDNIGNVLIAENMAMRMGADVLMVMQNLYVVHGTPGWSAKFLIACFNQCGRFSAIKYRFTGEKGKLSWGCIATTTEIGTGEIIEGTEITMEMAKAEGWSTKNGSKWKTMPEQMLRYRAATFLIRTTAPEIGMGLMTREELNDTTGVIDGELSAPRISSLDDLTNRLESDTEEDSEDEQLTTVEQAIALVTGCDTKEEIQETVESILAAWQNHMDTDDFSDACAQVNDAAKKRYEDLEK